MARSYLPSRAKAVPRAASATASGTAAPVWAASSTRLRNCMATGIMSLALCRFSTTAGGDVNAAQKQNAHSPACRGGGDLRRVGAAFLFRSEQQLRAELEGARFVGTRSFSDGA